LYILKIEIEDLTYIKGEKINIVIEEVINPRSTAGIELFPFYIMILEENGIAKWIYKEEDFIILNPPYNLYIESICASNPT